MDYTSARGIWTVVGSEQTCSSHGRRTYVAVVSASCAVNATSLLIQAFPEARWTNCDAWRGLGAPPEVAKQVFPFVFEGFFRELSRPEHIGRFVDDGVLFTATYSLTLWGQLLIENAFAALEKRGRA